MFKRINFIGSIFGNHPITIGIMMIILSISVVSILKKRVFAILLLHPLSIFRKNEYHRLFTADLVHNDLTHLIFNEVSLYIFGASLEEFLNNRFQNGSIIFLVIFIASGIAGNTILTFRYRNDHSYMSAGCSGCVMGCLFAFMLVNPGGTAFNFYLVGGIKNIYTGLIYILILVFFGWKRPNDIVNHELHFYGAVGGIISTIGLCHEVFF